MNEPRNNLSTGPDPRAWPQLSGGHLVDRTVAPNLFNGLLSRSSTQLGCGQWHDPGASHSRPLPWLSTKRTDRVGFQPVALNPTRERLLPHAPPYPHWMPDLFE